MKFGVREICDVVLRAKAPQKIGNKIFYKNEPVIYFDTLKTSSMEGSATTNYANGGRGNTRLMAWEGERTVTFTMEDALISPEGFMILSGAGLIEASETNTIKQHMTETVDASQVIKGGYVVKYKLADNIDALDSDFEDKTNRYLTEAGYNYYKNEAGAVTEVTILEEDPKAEGLVIPLSHKPYVGDQAEGDFIYVMLMKDGEIVSEPIIPDHSDVKGAAIIVKSGTRFNHIAVKNGTNDVCDNHVGEKCKAGYQLEAWGEAQDKNDEEDCLLADNSPAHAPATSGHVLLNQQFDSVLVDYYVEHTSGAKQIEIDAEKFGGNYYLEASTLFRDTNGVDMPAEFIIPNCKIQSNFNFSMASTGDPSTFTFTMDAFPDYTRFDHSKKVLAAIQIIEAGGASQEIYRHSTRHEAAHDALTW